ncbi:MAG: S9 family peptidase [Bacteroidia bacterium]|nr:S9 family peptidase [Bacteroidia bacterium]
MRKLFSILLIFFYSFTFGQSALTTELLWKLGRVNEFDISPDGKTVVYVVKRFDLRANKGKNYLYSIPVAGGEPKLLLDENWNINSIKFTDNGLAFLCAKSGEMQLWKMNLTLTEPAQITDVSGGINGFLYSKDGRKLIYAADVKTRNTIADLYPDLPQATGKIADGLMYRHWDSWEDAYSSHLFVADVPVSGTINSGKDLLIGESFDAPTQPFGGMEEVAWSPDGKYIAYTCKKLQGTAEAISTNTEIYLYNTTTGITVNITAGYNGYDKNPQFSPDGNFLVWMSMETPGYESDKNRLMEINLKSFFAAPEGNPTQPHIRDLTLTFPHSVENFSWVNNAMLSFTATVSATQQVFTFNRTVKSLLFPQLTKGDHDYISVATVASGKETVMVGSRMSISAPAELYVINMKTGAQRQLTFENSKLLNGINMGKVEKRMVKTTDGKDMLTWVVLPPDFDANKKYPALLYCQGGPQSPVSQFFSYRWNFQLMAAKGYIVVAPNRRGLPGFGEEWNDAIVGDYGGQCMRDYLSAIDDVSKETYVNKEKLGAVGASFGGYSVYWLAGNHNKRFKCFIAHCGMFNMESWYGSTEEMFFANHDNKGPYWQEPKPANFSASPHLFVKNWDTPILVIHNEKDFRVPVTQGMEAFTAAQLKGVPGRFLSFPDENHWMLKPQNSVLWQREFFRWLDQWLK